LGCERAVEDWYDPDEEVFAPVSSIGAGSTALMLMLIGWRCELDGFVPDPDAEAELSTGTRSSLVAVVAEFSAC
jgi:hypothetical protein